MPAIKSDSPHVFGPLPPHFQHVEFLPTGRAPQQQHGAGDFTPLVGFIVGEVNRRRRAELFIRGANRRPVETALVLRDCFFGERVLCAGPVVENPSQVEAGSAPIKRSGNSSGWMEKNQLKAAVASSLSAWAKAVLVGMMSSGAASPPT